MERWSDGVMERDWVSASNRIKLNQTKLRVSDCRPEGKRLGANQTGSNQILGFRNAGWVGRIRQIRLNQTDVTEVDGEAHASGVLDSAPRLSLSPHF